MNDSQRGWTLSLILLLGGAFAGCQRAEQMIDDPAVFRELDALYTAITSHRMELLQASQARLQGLHENKQISDAGFQSIFVVIERAEQGEWQPAAESLYHLMRQQRKK